MSIKTMSIKSRKSGKGFSMIEILVALVILAVGLLGMATLMMQSLQTSQSAAMRSVATQGAYDLIERMRSNTHEDVLKNRQYQRAPQTLSRLGYNAPADCNNTSAKDLANCDVQVWAGALNKSLPDAWAAIQNDGTVDGENRRWCIALFWPDSGAKGSGKACNKEPQKAGNWASYEVKVLL